MKKNKLLLLACLSLCSTSFWAAEKQIASPDGKMTVTVSDEGGKPVYMITRSSVVFVEKSPLGLNLNMDDLTQGLTMKDCQVKTVYVEHHQTASCQL